MTAHSTLHLALYTPSILFLGLWYLGGGSTGYGLLDPGAPHLLSDVQNAPGIANCLALYAGSVIALLAALLTCTTHLLLTRSRDETIVKAILVTPVLLVTVLYLRLFVIFPRPGLELKPRLSPTGLFFASFVFGTSAMTVVLFKHGTDLLKASRSKH